MKKLVFFLFVTVGFTFQAFASDLVLTERQIKVGGPASGVGNGFDLERTEITPFMCVDGEQESQIIVNEVEPFATPEIIARDGEVRVIFSAVAKHQLLMTMKTSGKMRRDQHAGRCGSMYLSEMLVGAEIVVERIISVASSDTQRLAEVLKNRVTNLSSVLTLDLSNENLQITGGGFGISGAGRLSTPPSLSMCGAFGEKCDEFVAEMYQEAASLNERYPAERVKNLKVWGEPYGSGQSPKPHDPADSLSYKFKNYR